MPSFDYLEGKKFCAVFIQVVDPETQKVRLHCFRGRASIERGRVNVVDANNAVFTIPGTALNGIMPSDDTELLKGSEYFCLVKTDENIDFVTRDSDERE